MKLLPFLFPKRKTDFSELQSAHSPYERLKQRALVAEDALQLIEQTRQKGYRPELCEFDVPFFDSRGECAGCPSLHVCTRRSARQEAALNAMLAAQINSCYMLLYDMRVALDFRENNTQMLYARLNVDIGLYSEGEEQKKSLKNAADAYQKLFTVTGEQQYYAFIRSCAHILAGDRDEARSFLRQKGAFD